MRSDLRCWVSMNQLGCGVGAFLHAALLGGKQARGGLCSRAPCSHGYICDTCASERSLPEENRRVHNSVHNSTG